MRALVLAAACLLSLIAVPDPPAEGRERVRSAEIGIEGDAATVWYPAGSERRLPVALLLPGANVRKQYYAGFAAALADYGFVVLVPEHYPLPFIGYAVPSEHLLNRAVAWARVAAADPSSAIGAVLDPGTLVVAGHSYGAAAALYAAADRCQPPFCFGLTYRRPPELRAIVGHGANTTVGASVDEVAVRNIPVMFVNGSNDGVSELAEAHASFMRLSGSPSSAFVNLLGANHFCLTDENNPPGAAPDPRVPTTTWGASIATTARWTAMWFLAQLGDRAARDYVYRIGPQQDSAVTVELR
ncbi:poly(ethylene terephthalate) hydrolase family protein [Nocardia goodfellowii]|uniref:Dienelactone hydrolase n=1 Tax=Nocardia goodfellowii TaxID=882446 RepID=A0ABS4QLZ9_9NOCA|nr:hypothetical protein [Nocardia goodfellowii]MBP2192736.1 putative dienelactone hydrolase [Nocardia goodfellowii]